MMWSGRGTVAETTTTRRCRRSEQLKLVRGCKSIREGAIEGELGKEWKIREGGRAERGKQRERA